MDMDDLEERSQTTIGAIAWAVIWALWLISLVILAVFGNSP